VWYTNLRYMIIYEFFGFLWVAALIIACSQFVITVTVCIWYFSSTSDNRGKTSLWTGIKWIFRYNFGSLAFGSLLLAVIWFAIVVFNYMRRKLEKGNNIGLSSCIKCLLCCCNYCLQCCERFIRFLNKQAYV